MSTHNVPTDDPNPSDEARVVLVVTYADHQIGFYPVDPEQGWRIDAALRCLVIGRRIPRTIVPLDNVHRIEITER